MEDIKDTTVVEKTTSQEEIDNAVASAKKRWEKKLENYVSKEDYENLQTQLKQAQNELKLPKLQEQFVKLGGKQEAFKSFVTLNPKIFECKDDKEVQTLLETAKKDLGFMFNNQTFNATVGNDTNVVTKDNDPIGHDYKNGSLLRTK